MGCTPSKRQQEANPVYEPNSTLTTTITKAVNVPNVTRQEDVASIGGNDKSQTTQLEIERVCSLGRSDELNNDQLTSEKILDPSNEMQEREFSPCPPPAHVPAPPPSAHVPAPPPPAHVPAPPLPSSSTSLSLPAPKHDGLLDSLTFPPIEPIKCHPGFCECESVDWNTIVVSNTRDGRDLFDALENIEKQAKDNLLKERELRRQEACRQALEQQLEDKQDDIASNMYEEVYSKMIVSNTQEIDKFNRTGKVDITDRTGSRYFGMLYENFHLISRENEIWDLGNEESIVIEPSEPVDENAFTLEQCTNDLLLIDRTLTVDMMKRKIDRRNDITKRMEKKSISKEHFDHYCRFFEAHNSNIGKFRDCLLKDDPSIKICDDIFSIDQQSTEFIKDRASKLTFFVVFNPKATVDGNGSLYRSDIEQREYESSHKEAYDKTMEKGYITRFKSEKFKIPEHVEHFKKYVEVHRQNLEALQSLARLSS